MTSSDSSPGSRRRTGLGVEVVYELGYPVTVNDDTEYAFAKQVVADLFGADRFQAKLTNPEMGSEDMAFVMELVPSAYFDVGACPVDDFESAPDNHSPRAAFDDAVLPDAAAWLAEVALRRLRPGPERNRAPTLKCDLVRAATRRRERWGAGQLRDHGRPGGRTSGALNRAAQEGNTVQATTNSPGKPGSGAVEEAAQRVPGFHDPVNEGSGRIPGDSPHPFGRRLRRVWRARLQQLPEETGSILIPTVGEANGLRSPLRRTTQVPSKAGRFLQFCRNGSSRSGTFVA